MGTAFRGPGQSQRQKETSPTHESLLSSRTSQNWGMRVSSPALLLSEVTPGSSVMTSGPVPASTVQPPSQRHCPHPFSVASSGSPLAWFFPCSVFQRQTLPSPGLNLCLSSKSLGKDSFAGSTQRGQTPCSLCRGLGKRVGLLALFLSDGRVTSSELASEKPAFQGGLRLRGPQAASLRARGHFTSLIDYPQSR